MRVTRVFDRLRERRRKAPDWGPMWQLNVRTESMDREEPLSTLLAQCGAGPVIDWTLRHGEGLGHLESCAVTNDRGEMLWDQYRAISPDGAVVVPWFAVGESARIILRHEFRPIMKAGNGSDGTWLWAVPRGFSNPGESPVETASRELREETGCTPIAIAEIGRVNPDTAFRTSASPVFAAQVDPPKDLHLVAHGNEPVRGLRGFAFSELWELNLECGFTMAALFAFVKFARYRGFLAVE
jgi:ADP-ribose pyrophosphatase YjhB (NUDIX family)